MSESNRQKMIDALAGVRNKRMTPFRATICCPYHADTNPSATINLSLDKPVPLGWFGCWACKKSVPWNTLAKTLGLPLIGGEGKKKAEDYIEPERFKDELLEEEDKQVAWKLEYEEMVMTDIEEDWRSVPRGLLKKVGAKMCTIDGRSYVWLPVMIQGELRGYVKATVKKPAEGSSYFNASGTWSAQYGLIFYDYAVELAKRKGLNTVVLVEGPRDALRLLRYGIPAMAVLGAINFNEEKRYTLETSGIENLVIFMDGDDAGKAATKVIRPLCKMHFNIIKTMKLWKERTPRIDPKTGKQAFKKLGDGKKRLLWDNELDPGNCPKKYLREVRDALV